MKRKNEYLGYRSLSAEEIRKSREEIARGEFVTLEALRQDVSSCSEEVEKRTMPLTPEQKSLRDAGKPLKFRHLTDEQVEKICNGCGGKGGLINPPEYMFEASCNYHDFSYFLGCTEEHRRKADIGFRKAMLRDASRAPWWSRWWLKGAAWRYYWAVRWCGRKYFHYGEKERSWEDVE